MQLSPSSEINNYLVIQEIPTILRNTNIHCRVYKKQTLVLILSQKNPIHSLAFYFVEINFNITLLSTLSFPGSFFPLIFH
jgi:hypothetical protein